jgi:hypothetical protein
MEIHYVVEADLIIPDQIVEFCETNAIPIHLRQFNPILYSEDSRYITHLPAIHIFKKNVYQDTVYPEFKAVQFLQMEFDKYQLEVLERDAKTQIWEERLRYLRGLFRSSKTDSKSPRNVYK